MFIEAPRFPDDISLGVSGGPEFVTDLGFNPGGFSIANATRDLPLHKYDAAHGVRNHAQFLVLKNLFMNCRGRWAGFRFKDWSDFRFDFDDGVLVATSAPFVFQLAVRYAYGSAVFLRPIRKPVVGTVTLQRDGEPVDVGAGAGEYLFDTTTGLVTFGAESTPESLLLLTAAGEFDLPMRFDTDFMQASMDYSKRLHTWGQIPLVELRNPG